MEFVKWSKLANVFGAIALLVASGNAVADPALQKQAQQIFGKLPTEVANKDNPITDAKIYLGRKLYYETKLSKAGDLSCNSCHDLARFGVDGEPTSPGHEGQRGNRNSPTVYNAALHFVQFWDGRAVNVEEQAKGPILNPVEMAMPSEAAVVKLLKGDREYVSLFKQAYPDQKNPITYDNLARAIGAFERRLMTPSRFDAYLAGDTKALSNDERKGLKAFIDTGCITCHSGPALGGGMYQKLGLVRPFETKDRGRAEVTKATTDEKLFKVPSLRNIAETAPYFHDGSVKEIEEAIRLMAAHQLGKDLKDQEVASIATFLRALTGKIDTAYIAQQ